MTIFFDSDVLMEILRGQDQAILSTWRSLAEAGAVLLFSPVSAAEIWAAARAHEHVHIVQLFRPLLCASIDCETG
jgi:predicted nucleic acid-binding protein